MLISIVTPSYNQGQFLEQTIRSVLAQDYARIEYIVVDGGSSDGSQDVIERYADRLAWWTSEPDRGQADAIRRGFARARGEVLAWLNSDDLLAPGAVSDAAAALQAHPEAGLVYGNAVSIDADGRPLNDMIFRSYTAADLAAFRIICQPAVFMRRRAYRLAGELDPDYHFLLDHHLWLRIAGRLPVVHVPRLWAFARQHAAAKNVAQAEQFGEEAHRIAGWMATDPVLAPVYETNRSRVRAGALRFDARYMLDGGAAGPALKAYLRALAVHPPSALIEWHRILFSALSVIGLEKAGELFYRWKRGRGARLAEGVGNVSELYRVSESTSQRISESGEG